MERELARDASTEDISSGEESVKLVDENVGAANPENPAQSLLLAESVTNINVDAIVQRTRRDIMFELRRLQHGERPVTGGEYRTAVENLLAARFESRPNVEETDRPEEVRVEIQGLIQSRPVSGILRSNQFRRRLENIVRNHFQPQNDTPATNQARNTESNNENHSANTAPQLPEINYASYSESRRDELIMEISTLVHQQLVSSTLNSPFRDSLEQVARDRRNRTGTDGTRVQQAIRNLPPSNIARNDFSRFGISDFNDNDSTDSVSVINATAAVHVNNSKIEKEMASMKTQIKELTNLVQQQIELQFETQRSIRQEVAAALAMIQQTPREETRMISRPITGNHCVICTEKDADCMLYRCGHICTCYFCGQQLEKCPVCRAQIKEVVKAYKCSFDA